MPISKKLIAPCGMNCALCLAYLREKNHCPGCRGDDKIKQPSCRQCSIKNCPKLLKNKWRYCFRCDTFPCARLRHLDERYRTKYEMSMLDNLEYLKQFGITKFIFHEKKRWAKGDNIYCVHHHKYYEQTKSKRSSIR
jgi:hypothetical protein